MEIKIIQRIVPSYRQVFFKKLHEKFGDNFRVFTSFNIGKGPLMSGSKDKYVWLREIGNVYELPGICWQSGVFKFEINKGDIIIIEGSMRIVSNFVIILRSYFIGAKLIWWGHYWSASSKTFLANIRHRVMKRIPYLLFYTDYEIDRFKRDHLRKNNLFSLNNGVDIESIRNYRKKFIAKERDIDILFLGRISEKANVIILLKSLLEKECLIYNATFFGAQDNNELQRMNNEIINLSLGDRVTVLKGSSLEGDVAEYANRAKIFCYPGQVGLSLLHAMAYGLPSIVHNDESKQMPEFCAFQEGKSGISFENNSTRSLACAIHKLLTSPDSDGMSSFCIELVENKYTLDLMRNNFIQMIDSL